MNRNLSQPIPLPVPSWAYNYSDGIVIRINEKFPGLLKCGHRDTYQGKAGGAA